MINVKNLLMDCKSVVHIEGEVTSELLGFCSDTRQYVHPSFFVAYPGAKHNPLEHVESILEKGCPIVIYEKNPINDKLATRYQEKYQSTCFIKVKDSVLFTQEISSSHTREWQKRGGYIFAISGSNGKTTHKEMLSFILNKVFPGEVESTQKNNNNHLGVPFTLLQIKPNTKICILELGSNHPGEIKVLCDISKPQGGLVTNIGATHLEFFDNLENVFLEEGYLYEDLTQRSPTGMMFLQNLDDAYLNRFKKVEGIKTFSRKDPSADFLFEVNIPEVTIHQSGIQHNIKNVHIAGTHNYTNLATAFSVAHLLFPNNIENLKEACGLFRPTFNRSQWQRIKNVDVFLDAYNANPSSMRIALSGFFEEMKTKKVDESKVVLILGDMNELGQDSDQYHQDLGTFLRAWPLAKVVFIGRFAQHYLHGLSRGISFRNVGEIDGVKWEELVGDASHVFIKGSRSLQLESLLAIT